MTERKTDREILKEYDECDNPVTRSVLKEIATSRLRDAVDYIDELEERLSKHEDL